MRNEKREKKNSRGWRHRSGKQVSNSKAFYLINKIKEIGGRGKKTPKQGSAEAKLSALINL